MADNNINPNDNNPEDAPQAGSEENCSPEKAEDEISSQSPEENPAEQSSEASSEPWFGELADFRENQFPKSLPHH